MTWQTGVLNLGDDENGSLSQKVAEGTVTLNPTAASELLRALPNAAKPEVADWPASREEWAEAARLEAEAEAELADAESLDDPVRMYLREIGRVDLLNARQEKTLARKAEGWKALQSLEAHIRETTGHNATIADIALNLLNKLTTHRELATLVIEHLELETPCTLITLKESPDVIKTIDIEMHHELAEEFATKLGTRAGGRRKRNHRVLPPAVAPTHPPRSRLCSLAHPRNNPALPQHTGHPRSRHHSGRRVP